MRPRNDRVIPMLSVSHIQANLTTRQLGREITYYPSTDSTNADLWRLVDEGESVPGQVVVTDHQRRGRGRQGRSWFQEPEMGLPFSVLVYPRLPVERISLLTLAAGISLADALAAEGVPAALKWPNDILVGGRKLGGILAESRQTDQGLTVVIGIGLNVNEQAGDFPRKLQATAVSVRMVLRRSVQRELLLAGVLNRLEGLLPPDPAEVVPQWLERCAHRDTPVRFHGPREQVEGLFLGLDDQGRARIEVDGEVRLLAGEELALIEGS